MSNISLNIGVFGRMPAAVSAKSADRIAKVKPEKKSKTYDPAKDPKLEGVVSLLDKAVNNINALERSLLDLPLLTQFHIGSGRDSKYFTLQLNKDKAGDFYTLYYMYQDSKKELVGFPAKTMPVTTSHVNFARCIVDIIETFRYGKHWVVEMPDHKNIFVEQKGIERVGDSSQFNMVFEAHHEDGKTFTFSLSNPDFQSKVKLQDKEEMINTKVRSLISLAS